MKKIIVPTKDEVDAKAKTIFGALESKLGIVPNLYATMGYSSEVLAGYLNYAEVISASNFTKKETEAIKLAVSEVNNCEYCKAAHTAIAKMNGFTEQETIAIRKAQLSDKRTNLLVEAAQQIAANKGKLSEELKESFFAEGFDNKALIDLVAIVNVTSFTNFLHNATQVPIDFPLAPNLENYAA